MSCLNFIETMRHKIVKKGLSCLKQDEWSSFIKYMYMFFLHVAYKIFRDIQVSGLVLKKHNNNKKKKQITANKFNQLK